MNRRTCRYCGEPLATWKRTDARTCGDRCRKRLSLARQAVAVTATACLGTTDARGRDQDAMARVSDAARGAQP